jgi:aminopeptidase-like protein
MMSPLWIDEKTRAASLELGESMLALVRELYPVTRSIKGPGLRATVARLSEIAPLQITEVPSGTKVFDWTVPDEWSIDDAFIEAENGRRIVDLKSSNLHVVGYSLPVDATMTLAQLRPHLFSLPEHPDWIPYRTSYYSPNWGFCLADRVLKSLPERRYRAVIRSRLAPGSMTLAEHVHAGATEDEVLIFAHDCHPSLANDNLAGLAVAVNLAAFLRSRTTRYTYRFVFAPATIGSIAWLAAHEASLHRIRHGLVLSLLGDRGPIHYKATRSGDRTIDRAAWHVLSTEFHGSRKLDFEPWGYDERQFNSPGIDLAIGRLTRTPNGEFPEYHTSADNPDFLSADALGESWLACLKVLEALECDGRYVNLQPKGEPQLGRRGLYRSMGGYQDVPETQLALLWLLNLSDGKHSLLDIAGQSRLPFGLIAGAAADLRQAGLLAPAPGRAGEDAA